MRRLILLVVGLGSACRSAPRDAWPGAEWPKGRAVEVGLDSAKLAALDHDLAGGKYRYVDGMFVTRRGRLVYEAAYPHDYPKIYGSRDTVPDIYNYYDASWHPFYRGTPLHTLQSVSKSITSLVYGVAKTRGDLTTIDTAMVAFFPDRTIANGDDRKRRMTVRHLMTMTAGFDWDEGSTAYTNAANNAAIMEKSSDWVQYVLDRPMAAEPGSTFVYNSGATELLAPIFKRVTGHDLIEYAEQHLFAPIGITKYYWKRTRLGVPDTEGGLYLAAPDLARIGLLVLRGGRWDTTRVVSSEWLTESMKPAITARGDIKYGLKWWLHPYGPGGTRWAWVGNGYGGQRLIIMPDLDIVAVFTGWNIDENPPLPVPEMIDRLLAAVLAR